MLSFTVLASSPPRSLAVWSSGQLDISYSCGPVRSRATVHPEQFRVFRKKPTAVASDSRRNHFHWRIAPSSFKITPSPKLQHNGSVSSVTWSRPKIPATLQVPTGSRDLQNATSRPDSRSIPVYYIVESMNEFLSIEMKLFVPKLCNPFICIWFIP